MNKETVEKLIIIQLVLQLIDHFMTIKFLSIPGMIEANPFMVSLVGLPVLYLIFKVSVVILVYLGSMRALKKYPRVVYYGLITLNLWYVLLIANNIFQLWRT
ncbi:MAG: hypothetical protein DRN81_04245 [Thermoproteota archaeon]|nr:MAG: hypothetical protein DRN81_04245 [Candidatus Korarchaeota archaeon]